MPPMPENFEFADRLRCELLRKGMSISELCRLSGISRQHVHRIFLGKHNPSLVVCQKLMEPLGWKLAWKRIPK